MWCRSWLALVASGALVIGLMQAYQPQRRLKDSITFGYNDDMVYFPAAVMKASSFGYGHAFANILWLRLLQHTPPKKVEPNELSWIYFDLEAITEIDPRFYPAYEYGGIFLSVVTEDKLGAERILLKGEREFPDRWRIPAYLAYHYDWELGQPEKAMQQYVKAAAIPGSPTILKVRASNAWARGEGKKFAIEMLERHLKETDNPSDRKRILDKIRELEAK